MHIKTYITETPGETAKTFAARAGVSERAVIKWMRGERIPRPENMRQIASVTDGKVGPADFFGIP